MEREGCRHGIEVLEEQDTDIVLCNHMIYSCGERLSLCDDKGSKFFLCGTQEKSMCPFRTDKDC